MYRSYTIFGHWIDIIMLFYQVIVHVLFQMTLMLGQGVQLWNLLSIDLIEKPDTVSAAKGFW
jgi:hypothetical protein